jgi:tetratricopeptide (TPR) repeat protein
MSGDGSSAAGSSQAPGGSTNSRRSAWLAAVWLGLLVLPFHPYWVDFEQVRRGLLLVLAGGALLLIPTLPRVRGDALLLGLVAFLAGSALVNQLGDSWFRAANTLPSFQPWEAVARLSQWLGLWLALRLGAHWRHGAAIAFPGLVLATSLFGLLQRLGVAEIAGYGVEREPVSVFGNLNVASEWTAVAAMVAAVLWPQLAGRQRLLGTAALVAAGAYLVVNHSRSGLIGLPVGLVLLVLLRRSASGAAPLGMVLLGALLGWVVDAGAARPAVPPPTPAVAAAGQPRTTSTLAVRFEIARGSTKLFAESPVWGHGPGQFMVQYPRHRSLDEIEASSHGRQFATEVRTAHDDWLELLVDGGLPALVLFAAALFALQRGQTDKARLLPLLVLLLLMLVRAPLGNAPAVVAAVWLAGTAVPPPMRHPAWRRWLARLAGLALLALGSVPVLANLRIAPYLRAAATQAPLPLSAAEAAATCMPYEPRWHTLVARNKLRANDLAGARLAAATAVALRPFDPQAYELLVEVLVRGKAYDQARQLVQHALRLDPVHPELRLWRSWLALHQGNLDEAIQAVATSPHPMLRQQLADHFAAMANSTQEPTARRRLLAEHHFLAALDGLGQPDPVQRTAVGNHLKQFAANLARGERPARFFVLGAAHALDLGQPDVAIRYGSEAQSAAPLPGWQRELLRPAFDRLRSFESWASLVDGK